MTQFQSVLQCLDELAVSGSPLFARANGLRSQLRGPCTNLLLLMTLRVFQPLENLNRSLQSTRETVSGMIQAVSLLVTELKAFRTNDDFKTMLDSAKNMQK